MVDEKPEDTQKRCQACKTPSPTYIHNTHSKRITYGRFIEIQFICPEGHFTVDAWQSNWEGTYSSGVVWYSPTNSLPKDHASVMVSTLLSRVQKFLGKEKNSVATIGENNSAEKHHFTLSSVVTGAMIHYNILSEGNQEGIEKFVEFLKEIDWPPMEVSMLIEIGHEVREKYLAKKKLFDENNPLKSGKLGTIG